ncbi:MAG: VWA domain-containing protein [Ruminococcaceae bacterium]|nr:VWA domain-containing protein [Oscillospiraceae bacterium]
MKKIFSLLLALTMILLVVLAIPFPASAESLYIRKIVSVVYDDSGSMGGSKWAYANYAMQTFCGMLNSEDELYITYMADSQQNPGYIPENVLLGTDEIQNSVDSIRNHTHSGSTPYKAVEKAYNKLKSVQDSNPNTQYWLVVITDGDFDECLTSGMDEQEKKDFLNEHFKEYTETVMPNGTKPQVTFLGIGDVACPDADHSQGIYTYEASNATGIINAMAEMADRISGRTRLQSNAITKIDDKTVQVSSSIPLLNIAVLVQGSEAKIAEARHTNQTKISNDRRVALSYPGYSDLVGGAFLLGDSKDNIGAGTYHITFDQKVDLEDLVILFEPALEMRMKVQLNGKEVSDFKQLNNAMEQDKISVSCKIYEMGTDKEISPSLLPPGTKFEIVISENGKITEQVSGQNMILSDYVLKNVETEIWAAAIIDGFNPIAYSVEFEPTLYIPDYTISAEFVNNTKSLKYDDVAGNKDLSIAFTVYEVRHGSTTEIKDPNIVKSLNPVINVSPEGNEGNITYSSDGKIIFTPNKASESASSGESFSVSVTCALSNGKTATEKYTILMPTYQVIPIDATEPIKKTELFDNQVSVSFYVTKDGVRLDKSEVEKQISVLLGGEREELKTNVSVAPDGTITVTPYVEEQRTLNFGNWWGNWAYYWGLESDDIKVTLEHPYGNASSTIDVVGESFDYKLFSVWTPLLIEVIALAFFLTWIYLVCTKPRFSKSAVLYVGNITYNPEDMTHVLRFFAPVRLEKFNKIQKGNGRLKFKKKADVVNAGGLKIRADYGGRIICEMPFPWYRGGLEPCNTDLPLHTPSDVAEHVLRHRRLDINEFATTTTVNGENDRTLVAGNPRMARYTVVAGPGDVVTVDLGNDEARKVITRGKIFIYTNS